MGRISGMLARIRITETTRSRSTNQQPGMKSGRRPSDTPDVNRALCSLIRFTQVFVCSCIRGDVRDGCLPCPGGQVDGCLLGAPTSRCPIPPCPALPCCCTPHRRAPTVICPAFGLESRLLPMKCPAMSPVAFRQQTHWFFQDTSRCASLRL